MTSLIEILAERTIGSVEEVRADQITVRLDLEAPQSTALNASYPVGFPRIGGYLLLPHEAGATVGNISSVRVERTSFPKRKGMQDFGIVDLPFPTRVLSLTPLGTLAYTTGESGPAIQVKRGVDIFPSVGDPVVIPTTSELKAIIEGESADPHRRICLGSAPMADRADVYVDPDKLFGRHLAVLGNTGAGKSCSVAGMIRWSIEAARLAIEVGDTVDEEASGNGADAGEGKRQPNARFIILDPNGEYARAFSDLDTRIFMVEAETQEGQLKLPAWLWNGEEWAAFSAAAPGVQRPLLLEAIRRMRMGSPSPDPFVRSLTAKVNSYSIRLKLAIQNGEHQGPGRREGMASVLENIAQDFEALAQMQECPDDDTRELVQSVSNLARKVEQEARSGSKTGGYWHEDFSFTDIEGIIAAIESMGDHLEIEKAPPVLGEDIPKYFDVESLPDYVKAIAADRGSRDLAQFVDSLELRLRGLLSRGRLSSVLMPPDSSSIQLDEWLTEYIGDNQASNGQIVVLDLSLVPSDVVHVVVASLARLVFEAVQRYRRLNSQDLPTVLILEEAHTFVHRDLSSDHATPAGRACYSTFERIAREGRKFGLGLVLSSQRPSEMSPTVLSQCNTFLLHRIVNDLDQRLVRRLVPDALGSLLQELPSLPTRRAILLGWATPAPTLVEIKELSVDDRPQSPDPRFWEVWTGALERTVDWKSVATDWQGDPAEAPGEDSDPTEPSAQPSQ